MTKCAFHMDWCTKQGDVVALHPTTWCVKPLSTIKAKDASKLIHRKSKLIKPN
jgi:hypothetical protein